MAKDGDCHRDLPGNFFSRPFNNLEPFRFFEFGHFGRQSKHRQTVGSRIEAGPDLEAHRFTVQFSLPVKKRVKDRIDSSELQRFTHPVHLGIKVIQLFKDWPASSTVVP